MPQKKVYGKKSVTTVFESSNFFSTRSPQIRRRMRDIDCVAPSFDLKQESVKHQSGQGRRPLGEIDLNAKLQSLSLNEESKKKQDAAAEKNDKLDSERSDSYQNSKHVNDQQQCETLSQLQLLLELNSDHSIAPQPFSEWGAEVEANFTVTKIAEATYGEVYRLRYSSDTTTCADETSKLESVLKIIALKAPTNDGQKISKAQKAREANMSPIESVISELRLLRRMATVPGFVNLRGVRVVQGRPPKVIARAWTAFNDKMMASKGEESEFADPSKKSSYLSSQLWAIIEMQDAGTDLEQIRLPTVFHVWDVFWNVALSLGKAEAECRFEHRDLHLGNICVQSSPAATNDIDKHASNVQRISQDIKLGFTGLRTTIIDYTLSRASLVESSQPFAQVPRTPQKCETRFIDDSDTSVAYFDLEGDPGIFEGDASVDPQYEVYRQMRNIVVSRTPSLGDGAGERTEAGQISPIDWRGYHPLTNLAWLSFVLQSLLRRLSDAWPSTKEGMVQTLEHTSQILQGSAEAIAAVKSKACRMEKKLRLLQEILATENLEGMAEKGLTSAGDLVWLATEFKWLRKKDVLRCR